MRLFITLLYWQASRERLLTKGLVGCQGREWLLAQEAEAVRGAKREPGAERKQRTVELTCANAQPFSECLPCACPEPVFATDRSHHQKKYQLRRSILSNNQLGSWALSLPHRHAIPSPGSPLATAPRAQTSSPRVSQCTL